jgi:hypothetical protein
MNTEIFLNGYESKKSSNTSGGLDVSFKGKRKLLPLNDFGETISQYDQYMEEREKCNVIRLTCQVNVIASNVLFNKISEIVKDEGSSGVSLINYAIADADDFNDVVYKDDTIGFWSGNEWQYQARASWDVNTVSTSLYVKQQEAEYGTNGVHSGITYDKHCTNAIRDTQLSNCGFIYHCGLDIFNNHLIRSNVFKWVNKLTGGTYSSFNTIADLFRNIDGNNIVERIYFPKDAGVKYHTKLLALHLYEYDDVDTFLNATRKKLIDRYDGWYGFKNRNKIYTYENFHINKRLKIDKPIMYANGGDFIEMYPDSELYSFVPKYNTFQKRYEKNWNYCITYPSSSTTEGFGDIIETNYEVNALKALYFDENTRYDNGVRQIVIHSIAKHGLSVGDYVNIYKTYETTVYYVIKNYDDDDFEIVSIKSDDKDFIYGLADEFNSEYITNHPYESEGPYKVVEKENEMYTTKIIDNAEVADVVDDYTFVFFNSTTQISKKWVILTDDEIKKNAVTVDDIHYTIDKRIKHQWVCTNGSINKYYVVNESYVNFDDDAQNISFKKVVDDIECDYYIRIFSKLPNFKFCSADTSTQFELYKNDQETIRKYRDIEYDFQNSPTRLAYSQNIYGDLIGEIVFMDDIDMSNIVDNLGRPLTSLYLTFIKNNKGYKEWYGYVGVQGNGATSVSGTNGVSDIWENGMAIRNEYENIEFSHCFGKVTCGIECSDETAADNLINNIKTLSNIVNKGSLSGHGYSMWALNHYSDILVDSKFTSLDEKGDRKYHSSKGTDIKIDRNEIWYEIDENFYGDLCCYDSVNAIERPIQQVLHRFNTEQRESVQSLSADYFRHYNYDEIWKDDYDTDDYYEIRTYYDKVCNSLVEGYYYIPHYELPVHYFGKVNYLVPDFLTIRQIKKVGDESGSTYTFTCLENHFLKEGDKAIIYDMEDDLYYSCITVSGENDSFKVFTCDIYEYKPNKETEHANLRVVDDANGKVLYSNSQKINRFRLFKADNLGAPSYAKLLKDGTCRFIWRDIFKNGTGIDKKEIEEYTYTNNAFYVNKKVDLFVKRQDKYNLYDLYNDFDLYGKTKDLTTEDNYIKDTEIEC